MIYIKRAAEENGSRCGTELDVPINDPEWMPLPPEWENVWREHGPFVEVRLEAGQVVEMTPMKNPPETAEPPAPQPTELDRLAARVDYISMMGGYDV